MIVTGVFYDPGRKSWVVEYDDRPDRQSHFGSKVRAINYAEANGWTPPPGWVAGDGFHGPRDIDDSD